MGALTQRGVGAGREVPRRPGLANVPVFGHRRCVHVHVATGTLQGSRGDSALGTRRDWRRGGGWEEAGMEEGGASMEEEYIHTHVTKQDTCRQRTTTPQPLGWNGKMKTGGGGVACGGWGRGWRSGCRQMCMEVMEDVSKGPRWYPASVCEWPRSLFTPDVHVCAHVCVSHLSLKLPTI